MTIWQIFCIMKRYDSGVIFVFYLIDAIISSRKYIKGIYFIKF